LFIFTSTSIVGGQIVGYSGWQILAGFSPSPNPWYPPGIERHVHASLPTTVIFFQKSTGRAGFLKCHRDGGIMEGFTVRLFET